MQLENILILFSLFLFINIFPKQIVFSYLQDRFESILFFQKEIVFEAKKMERKNTISIIKKLNLY